MKSSTKSKAVHPASHVEFQPGEKADKEEGAIVQHDQCKVTQMCF